MREMLQRKWKNYLFVACEDALRERVLLYLNTETSK
jgi:hypothetical protein